MHDNDVRDLLARVVGEAGPRPVSREEMVAAGRRARNRRRRWWVGGVALAAVAAVAATTQVVPAPSVPGTVGTPGTVSASGTVGARSPGVTKSPTGRAVSTIPEAQQQRANQMLAVLIAAIPAGYTTPAAGATPAAGHPLTRYAYVQGWQQTGWRYSISTEVYRDGKAGMVRVSSFTDYGPPGTNDPCAAAYQAAGSYDGCTVLTAVTGTPVSVSWRGGSGKVPREVRATWVADDRAVSVEQGPGAQQPGFGMLDQPVFTDQELADLAVLPDFRG
ncbi:hypothetical protein [Dactylosporangium sp. NPDC049140]|uniref:hypothetical protein n=1 Tax=Dactylosporangium sp. NPDC049140 TaxID=3155647 RepID=UPI0033C64779